MTTKKLAEQYKEASDYLWNFVGSVGEHSVFMQQYKGEYELLNEKMDEYLDEILKLHCKAFDIEDFKNVYLDNVAVCCSNYYDDPIFPVSFVEIFSYLNKEKFVKTALKDFCVLLFGEEFEHITDGKSKESIYMSEAYKKVLLDVKEQVEQRTTNILTLDKMSNCINILKAITNSENEAISIFKYHDSDINKLITFIDDVVDGLRAVHSALYKHEAEDVCLVNLTKCKDYFYCEGHEHWGDDNFIEASYQAYDIVTGILDIDRIREVIESSFSESFIDLFSTKED